MKKYVLMNRTDGTGSRLFSLINTMWLSKKIFGDIDNAKFLWNETRFQNKGENKADSNNTTMRNFDSTVIIGASCENKESFFTDNFIDKHYIKEIDKNNSMSIFEPCGRSLEKFKNKFFESNFTYITNEIPLISDVFLDVDKNEYRKEVAQCWNEIDFMPKIRKMEELAISHAKTIGGG